MPDDFDLSAQLPVILPADLWRPAPDMAPATTWRTLDGSEREVMVKKVDFIGQMAAQERAHGVRNFRERVQARLELENDPHARQTVGNYAAIFDVFRVGLGYSREALTQYSQRKLRAIAQAKNDWAITHPEKVAELLESGQNEEEIRIAIDADIRGSDAPEVDPVEYTSVSLKMEKSAAALFRAVLSGVLRREEMGGAQFSTYQNIRLGQAAYVLAQDWVQSDTDIEGYGMVPNNDFMPGGQYGEAVEEEPEIGERLMDALNEDIIEFQDAEDEAA